MSLDASDLIDNLLDDQARVNSMADDGDTNNLVADFQTMTGELMGLTGAETAAGTSAGSPPHKYDDAQTAWNFFSYDVRAQFWDDGFTWDTVPGSTWT